MKPSAQKRRFFAPGRKEVRQVGDTMKKLLKNIVATVPCLAAFSAAPALHGQAQVGSLLYRSLSGRGVTLTIVEAGAGRATFKHEQGDANAFRLFIQRNCASESALDGSAKTLKEPAPPGYASGYGGGPLIKTAMLTYWRYGPGLVLPARFRFKGETWELIQAKVPAMVILRDTSPPWVVKNPKPLSP